MNKIALLYTLAKAAFAITPRAALIEWTKKHGPIDPHNVAKYLGEKAPSKLKHVLGGLAAGLGTSAAGFAASGGAYPFPLMGTRMGIEVSRAIRSGQSKDIAEHAGKSFGNPFRGATLFPGRAAATAAGVGAAGYGAHKLIQHLRNRHAQPEHEQAPAHHGEHQR